MTKTKKKKKNKQLGNRRKRLNRSLYFFRAFLLWSIIWNIGTIFLLIIPNPETESKIMKEIVLRFFLPLLLAINLKYIRKEKIIKNNYLFRPFIIFILILDCLLLVIIFICFYSELQLIIHPELELSPVMTKALLFLNLNINNE